MFTVEELLKLPVASHISVFAGREGLERTIRWSHVMDTDKVNHFLEGGEILLTCGQVWPQDHDSVEKFFQSLLEAKISGIIFATGYYMMDCPPAALRFGEQYAIPVLEMPFHIPFVRVTEEINRNIISSQYKMLSRKTQIPSDLAHRINAASHFEDICEIIANYYQCPVAITSLPKHILAKAIPPGGQRINIPKIIDHFIDEEGRLNNLRQEEQHYSSGISLYRSDNNYKVVAQLQTENHDWGAFWLFGDQAFTNLSLESFLYAAALLTERYQQHQENEVKQRQVQSEMLDLVLEGPQMSYQLVHTKLYQLGMDLDENQKWIIGVVPFEDTEPSHLSQKNKMDTLRYQWERKLNNIKGITGFCQIRDQKLIMLLSFTVDFSMLKGELQQIRLQLQTNDERPIVLIMGGVKDMWSDLFESYQETKRLTPLIERQILMGETYFADDHHRKMLLYTHFDSQHAKALREAILPQQLLFEHDNIFYITLKSLANHQFNREHVAEALHIHRNTLRYRIEKIEELLQSRLSSFRCQFWIQIAFDLESLDE